VDSVVTAYNSQSMPLLRLYHRSCRFNSFYLWFWFLSLLSFVWIGGQFPQDNFLSYGRILTLYYYFLLICILFSIQIIHLLYFSISLIIIYFL
jgi:hypothetical protein